MDKSMYDEDGPGPVIVNADQLKVISDLAAKQIDLETQVVQITASLKAATEALRRVQEIDLPDAMSAAGCKGFTTPNGRGITIKEDISASLSEGKREGAVAWLRENGFGDIVSEDVTLSFGKGHESEALEMVKELAGRGLIPQRKTNVNTATLKSLIRELMEEGLDVPLETLGAYQWKKAIIK